MSTSQKVNWPDLTLPPINLWNAPKMTSQFAVTVTFFISRDDVGCHDEDHAYNIVEVFLKEVADEDTILSDYCINEVEAINV